MSPRDATESHGLRQLRQLAGALAPTLDEEAMLDDLSRGLQRAFGVQGVVVATGASATVLRARRHFGDAGPRALPPFSDPERRLAAMLATGSPRLVPVDDPGTEALALDLTGDVATVREMLIVPLVLGHSLEGVAVLYDAEPDAFHGVGSEFTSAVAMVAGAALRHADIYARSERERRQSDAMADVARAVSESLRIAEVQTLILRHACALLQAAGACLVIRDGDYLVVEAAFGAGTVLAGTVLPIDGSLSGRVVRSGEALISNGVPAEAESFRRNLELVQVNKAVIVPLRTGRGCLGALGVFNRNEPFVEADARVLQRLADHVAVAVSNSRLFSELREATREWSATFDSIGVGVLVVGEDGRIVRANHAARLLVDAAGPLALVGRHMDDVLRPVEEEDPVRTAMDDGRSVRGFLLAPDARRMEIHAVPHVDGGAVVTLSEVRS